MSPDNDLMVKAVIAAQGDIMLAAERLNTEPAVVLHTFLENAGTDETGKRLRALLFLYLLELLGKTKDQLMTQLDEFSPSETLKAFQVVMEAIGAGTGAAVGANANAGAAAGASANIYLGGGNGVNPFDRNSVLMLAKAIRESDRIIDGS